MLGPRRASRPRRGRKRQLQMLRAVRQQQRPARRLPTGQCRLQSRRGLRASWLRLALRRQLQMLHWQVPLRLHCRPRRRREVC